MLVVLSVENKSPHLLRALGTTSLLSATRGGCGDFFMGDWMKEADLISLSGELMQAKASGGELQRFDPQQASYKLVLSDAVIRAAKKAKDAEMLKEGVKVQLETQAEIARDYKGRFKHGGDRSKSTDSVVLDSKQYASAVGVSDRSIQRWADKLLDPESYEKELEKRLKKVIEIVMMWQAANYSSESNEWYTPGIYIDYVRDVLGEIDLDPASSEQANEVVQAKQIYTEKDDALVKPWHGRVFLNPPYGKKDGESVAAMFCQKAINEYTAGNVEEAIILVNSVHSQKWQAPLYQFPVCFVSERIQFQAGDGTENKNPTFQNIFVYLGNNISAFYESFRHVGYVMVPYVN